MSYSVAEKQSDSQLGKKSKCLGIHFICSVCVYNHLMLELAGVPAADGDDAAVNVQLTDDGHSSFQLGTERLRGAATQTQQANQDVLLRILVGEEGLPAAVGHVVPPHQLHLNTRSSSLVNGVVAFFYNQRLEKYNTTMFHPLISDSINVNVLHLQDAVHYLVRSDFVVDLLNAHFSGSHVSTLHRETFKWVKSV